MFTVVIKNTAIFQREYASVSFVHVVEVMADLQANKIAYVMKSSANWSIVTRRIDKRSVYSPNASLSLFSRSCCLFLASSRSFFLFLLIHFSVSSTSSSASPRVVPFSDALSSRRFRTLSNEYIWAFAYSKCQGGLLWVWGAQKHMKRCSSIAEE